MSNGLGLETLTYVYYFIYFLKDESTNTTWSAFIKSAEVNPSGQCKEEAGLEG